MFLAKKEELFGDVPMGKQQTPSLEQPIFIQFVRSLTNLIQTADSCHHCDRFEADETEPSVTLGKKHHSEVGVHRPSAPHNCPNEQWGSVTLLGPGCDKNGA